ncbi:MAG TPA: MFS transporter [Spirochaetia bacterium]|nr:MFS transporter [Spirochaetia bacterium]
MKAFKFHSFFPGLLFFYVLAHFGHHVIIALTVPLLPYIRSTFALSYTFSGLLISAFSITYGVAQLPAGWLASRLGARALMMVGVIGVSLAGLMMGLSPSFGTVIFSLILMGVMGGGYHPAAASLISTTFEPRHQGRALGIHVIGGSASYFLSPLIGIAIASVWGWRGSYIGLSLVTTAFGIIFYLFLRKSAPSHGSFNSRPSVKEKIHTVLSSPLKLAPVLFLSVITGAVVAATISFLSLFIVDHFKATKESAAFWIALLYSTGLWAAPLGGYISDRLGRVPVILAVCLISAPSIYLLNVVPYGLPFGLLLIVMGCALFIRLPVTEAYILNQAPPALRSTVLGIYYFTSTEGSGVLTPLMGSLIDTLGFRGSLTAASLVLVSFTIITIILLSRVRYFKDH